MKQKSLNKADHFLQNALLVHTVEQMGKEMAGLRKWEGSALNVQPLITTEISKVMMLTCGILNLSFSLMCGTNQMV
jgi:hypothetical protein